LVRAGAGDLARFDGVYDDVFDRPLDADLLTSSLADPRLHIIVAVDNTQMIGICSGMHYHHPDKPPQMWVNELGVASLWRRRGVATGLVRALADLGRTLVGPKLCAEIRVLADPANRAEGFYGRPGWRNEGRRLVMFTHALDD